MNPMILHRWPALAAVPQTLAKRLEIIQAIHALGMQDVLARRRHAEIVGIQQDVQEIKQLIQVVVGPWAEEMRPLLRSMIRKYNPDQPRVPAGNPDGGEWINEGIQVAQNDTGEAKSDAIRPPGGQGHHWVPRGIYEKEPLRPETREVFENALSGPLADNSVNRWNSEHRAYNDAIQDAFNAFLQTNNITSEEMTAEQAQSFVDQVKGSVDPRIYNLKMKILHQALRHLDIWGGRGGDEE